MSDSQLVTTEPQAVAPAEPKKTKAPIAMSERGVQLSSLEELYRFSTVVLQSGMAPNGLDSVEKVMIATQMGMEVGLTPTQAVQAVAVINKRPVIWGDHALGVVRAHREFEDIEEAIQGEGEARTATCTLKRKDQTPVVRKFTVADAKKAGLLGKSGPWTQYPDRMLQMRARSWAMRDGFADALKGLGIREEAQDYNEKPARVTKETTLTFEEGAL